MSMNVEIDRIVEAADLIPRPFIRTAQYHSEGISRLLGLDVILKIETTNPVGSVMGRSAEW
ncbi:MAG: threonine/serine dehydratase, partial [Actinomycetia bacterium]|nr:threonine/serine dehydratase [Actinomycetes bacterium]